MGDQMTRNRVNLSLDAETFQLLKEVSDQSGDSVAGIVSQLLGAHMQELSEYVYWMESLKPGSRKHEFGKGFIKNYGPESLIEAIEQFDPTYRTKGKEFEAGFTSGKE